LYPLTAHHHIANSHNNFGLHPSHQHPSGALQGGPQGDKLELKAEDMGASGPVGLMTSTGGGPAGSATGSRGKKAARRYGKRSLSSACWQERVTALSQLVYQPLSSIERMLKSHDQIN